MRGMTLQSHVLIFVGTYDQNSAPTRLKSDLLRMRMAFFVLAGDPSFRTSPVPLPYSFRTGCPGFSRLQPACSRSHDGHTMRGQRPSNSIEGNTLRRIREICAIFLEGIFAEVLAWLTWQVAEKLGRFVRGIPVAIGRIYNPRYCSRASCLGGSVTSLCAFRLSYDQV